MNYQPRIPLAPIRLIEIGDAARRLGVTARTLRHYQDQGLVHSHRLARNVRGYDVGTLEQLKAIVALRGVGLPIAAIRDILALRDRPAAQSNALRAALAEALSEQQAQMARLTDLADHMAGDAADLPPTIAGLQADTAEPAA
jgi:MerR family transcriptional regulator, copper efflux regulator